MKPNAALKSVSHNDLATTNSNSLDAKGWRAVKKAVGAPGKLTA
jgi:hypothetical protein